MISYLVNKAYDAFFITTCHAFSNIYNASFSVYNNFFLNSLVIIYSKITILDLLFSIRFYSTNKFMFSSTFKTFRSGKIYFSKEIYLN